MQALDTDLTVSKMDFKKNPTKGLRDASAQAVAALSHGKAAFYMVEPGLFEAMLEDLADARLLPLLKRRIASAERGEITAVDIDIV